MLFIDLVDILESVKLSDDDASIDERPNRGNKISKKNKRKNKNQDLEDEPAGIIFLVKKLNLL